MKLTKPTFNLNQTATALTVVLAVVLIGGSAWAGYGLGTNHGKQTYVDNPPKTQSVSGKVKDVNDNGMTVTATNGEWKVAYLKTTTFRAGVGEVKKSEFKKGDDVRIIGTAGSKDKTVNAKTVTKVVPRASGAPVPVKKPVAPPAPAQK